VLAPVFKCFEREEIIALTKRVPPADFQRMLGSLCLDEQKAFRESAESERDHPEVRKALLNSLIDYKENFLPSSYTKFYYGMK
jgi:hypothetical protein